MFRILPGVEIGDPGAIWSTFENVKTSLNSALLKFHTTHPVEQAISTLEMAVPFKIPYFINPNTLETTPIWAKGALTVDVSVVAQNTDFDINIYATNFGVAPATLIFNQTYTIPAGSKLHYFFTDIVPDVDLNGFEGIVVSPEVPTPPSVPDRYVITVQLTFRPFRSFGVP